MTQGTARINQEVSRSLRALAQKLMDSELVVKVLLGENEGDILDETIQVETSLYSNLKLEGFRLPDMTFAIRASVLSQVDNEPYEVVIVYDSLLDDPHLYGIFMSPGHSEFTGLS